MSESLLEHIQSPRDLAGLSREDLERLAEELRSRITEAVAAHGGHLASNLGIVDLVLALHRAFDFSTDHLVFDVGHQCYAHKLLTGRAEGFRKLRTVEGVSGFPNPSESPEFDRFRTGHAGASISTALGLALAAKARGTDEQAVAVIGDGAMASGLALEALNHAGDVGADLLVVLNDNQMAIDRTVGALARYLTAVRTTPAYDQLKAEVHGVLDHMPLGGSIGRALHAFKESLKEAMVPVHAFEHFGFRCFGPVDGHDLGALEDVLEEVRRIGGPRLVHVSTEKGRGFPPAAEKPEAWHSAAPFTERNGEVLPAKKAAGTPSWTEAAVDVLIEHGEADPRIVALTAAMPEGTGLLRFGHRFPGRYWDVGICEEHAVALAAGLARGDLRPVVGIYSTFLQRSYDQLFHEVTLQGLPVLFLVDRAGLVGSDGPTHHGLYDMAYMRHLPGMTVAAPADAGELAGMVALALVSDGPWAIRYPRDRVPEADYSDAPVEAGRGVMLREGTGGAILALGATAEAALEAAETLAEEGMELAVASARFARPVDAELLRGLLESQSFVLTVEDHTTPGGFGSAVLEAAEAAGLDAGRIHRLAVPEGLVEHDTRAAQLTGAGLSAEGIAGRVREVAEAY